MIHLGDITKIDGANVAPVDVVIGGSPCQDLSVAGKRAGLDGARSGLFMEQIRIIKEMRLHSGATYPRFMVWENVPGAFSSNKGEDFRVVLEETARVADQATVIPRPTNGKWTNAGCIVADGWSIAWRVLDAQFWGVPQRRRRIALVADFGGQSAPEILFERESGTRYSAQSGETREGTAADVEGSVRETEPVTYPGVGITSKLNASKGTPGVCHTLNQDSRNYLVRNPTYCIQGNCIDRADTAGCNGKGWTEDVSYTLNTIDRPAVMTMQAIGFYKNTGICSTLKSRDYKDATDLVVAAVDCRNGTEDEKTNGTLQAKPSGGISLNLNNTVRTNASVRRLTPLECSRLQGYPDDWAHIPGWHNPTKEDIAWWTEVHYEWDKMQSKTPEKVKRKTERAIKRWLAKPTSDSAEYKAYGNSIAIPPWTYVLQRVSAHCGEKPTMASLFDGISGFPLIWERINGRGSCLWASEVDPFAIAVTKTYFGG